MTHRFWIVLVCLAGLAGCAPTTIRLAELPWTITPLSKHGCPDLTGTYKDRGALHIVFSAGMTGTTDDMSGDRFPATVKWIRNTPIQQDERSQFLAEALLSIRQTQTDLLLTYTDGLGVPYQEIRIRLDTEMTGCHDGAFVLRTKSVYGKYEGSSASIEFGETEIRRREDRALEVTIRSWNSALGFVSGNLTGPLRPRLVSVNRYPVARLP